MGHVTRQQPSATRQRRIFSTDYSNGDLVYYATSLGAQAYDQLQTIAVLTARNEELERIIADPARQLRRS